MPIQIDHMQTSIELTAPAAVAPREPGAPRPAPALSRGALRAAVSRLVNEELERFVRMRGLDR